MLSATVTAGPRPGGSTWSVPREWEGERAFIVAGGPSAGRVDLDRLRGRKVVVTNSSCIRVPWADYLVFGDIRWHRANRAAVDRFHGRVVAVHAIPDDRRVKRLVNTMTDTRRPPRLSFDPSHLALRWTVLTAALNLAFLLGSEDIVLLGADGQVGPNGESHHHAPHPWALREGWQERQHEDLASIAAELKAAGVTVRNASPGSVLPFWPVIDLEDVL